MTAGPIGKPWRLALLWLALMALVYAVLYRPAAHFQYVWDDLTTIRDSPQFDRPLSESLLVTQHGHIDETLTHLRDVVPAHDSYRPLLFLTFAAEVRAFGRSPAAMHVTNVLLGLIAALLAFGLGSALLESRPAGAAVAGLFALHPLQVEPVSYISARADLLCGLFALASVGMAVWASPADGVRRRAVRAGLIAGSCLFFLASLGCKEASVGLPLALGALWLVDRRRPLLAPCLALLAVLPVYFVTRLALLSGAPAMAHGQGVLRGVLAVPGLALQYLAIYVAPAHLSIMRPLRFEYLVVGWVMAALLLAPFFSRAHRRQTRASLEAPGSTTALVVAGLGWALVTVAPSALVASMLGISADRYAYLPLFGFALVSVALVRALWRSYPTWRRTVVVAGAGWSLLCLAVTHLAIGVWKDPYTLYANAVVAEPESSGARYGLGVALAKAGLWSASVSAFEKAVRLDPENMRAWNNLSVSYETLGRLDDSERAARRAIALSDGTHFRAWYNLATVHLRQNRQPEACLALDRALAINPGYTRAATVAAQQCGRRAPANAHAER
jgi:Tfp pilus assembly protein PilF